VVNKRPDQRPMKALPVLEARRSELETCVFCPKLCRSACPVSNAEPRETITPWGKMSMAYFAARGDVPLTPSYAQPAWACTGCYGCRESCDHKNDVTGTLYQARAALVEGGVMPEPVSRTIQGFAQHHQRTTELSRTLGAKTGAKKEARVGILVGCSYLQKADSEAQDAVRVAKALLKDDVAVVEGCCGLPLRMAGDNAGFSRAAFAMADTLARFERVLVVDAGCALTLRLHYPESGIYTTDKSELLVERAANELTSLTTIGSVETVRWHDPCRLGRGLGVYEAPRAVLTRILGRAPAEFDTAREKATCSGGGGLLPSTMPENARTIAGGRMGEHARAGGGRVVTGCASSLRSLRRADPSAHVDDIVTWMARSLR
jgi:Fe-S oxidoreductase